MGAQSSESKVSLILWLSNCHME